MAKKPDPPAQRVFQGMPAAPGIAVGKVRRLEEPAVAVEEREITPEAVDAELVRFHRALERAREEIEGLREATRVDLGEAEAKIFDVQLLVLKDPLAVDRTTDVEVPMFDSGLLSS